jgi:hypothetical protein
MIGLETFDAIGNILKPNDASGLIASTGCATPSWFAIAQVTATKPQAQAATRICFRCTQTLAAIVIVMAITSAAVSISLDE